MKKCTKCGKEKDLEMFHKDKHNRGISIPDKGV